jgi:hypothetical protein
LVDVVTNLACAMRSHADDGALHLPPVRTRQQDGAWNAFAYAFAASVIDAFGLGPWLK